MQAVLTHLRLLVVALSFSLLLLLCFGVVDSLVVAVVKPGGDSGGSDLTCVSMMGKCSVLERRRAADKAPPLASRV